MYFPALGSITPKANQGGETFCLTEKIPDAKASGILRFQKAQPQARHHKGRVNRLARVVNTTHLVANTTSLP